MAKLTLSFLLLFFVVAFSESSLPSDLRKEDVNGGDLPRSTPTILLPSEKPQSDAAAAVQIDPATDSNSQDEPAVPVAEDRPASEPEKIATVPLRTVTFRPDDHGGLRERMVPLSLRFPFRHGGRGCHHGHRQFRPRFPGREISFGNDMILSESGPNPESRGIERQMAGRWIRVHHRKPRFGFVNVAWKEDGDMKKRPDHHEEREDEEEREHHHRRWKEDAHMMKRPNRHEEREDEEEREDHHRRWKKEDKDMMKRPDRHEEHDDEEEREHHHRLWKKSKDMMKRPHGPEDHEDDEEREHHHHRHHHHFRRHHDHEDEDEERHGGEGIYKRIRKFLNHF